MQMRRRYDDGMESIVASGLVLLAASGAMLVLAALAMAPALLVSGIYASVTGPTDTTAADELDVVLAELAELTKV